MKLGIQEKPWTNAINTLQLQDKLLKISFYSNEPRTTIAPQTRGNIGEATIGITATSEQRKTPPLVEPSVRENNIQLMIPYTAAQTKTPQETATHASKMLDKAFGETTKTLYEHSKELPDSEVYMESAIMTAHLVVDTFVASAITGGVALFQNTFMESRSLDLKEVSLVAFIFAYTLTSTAYYAGAKDDSPQQDERIEMVINFLRQDIRRSMYPASIVHKYILPSFLYSLSRLTQEDMIVALPTK
jgi:hypothetical protein